MGDVVTSLIIDADTSGADAFTQSMGNAKSAADSGTSSIAGMSLAIAGVGIGFIGIMTALRGFVDYVGGVNQQLVDIATNAQLAGMSTAEFQKTLFAAKSMGVSDKDFVSGLDKIGSDLTAAGRGVTDFGKLFEANGLSIKDTNGQLISTKTALTDISGLMQNATPQVQQAIASIVGLTKDWIPFLGEGADAMEAQKEAASALGIVLDDSVVQKAKEFNAEWQLAIATWDLQFKASLAEILPLLIQLANIASSVINGVGQISGFFSRSLTPTDQMSSSDLSKQADAVAELADKMANLNGEMSEFQKFKLQIAKGALGLPEDADLKAVDAYQDKLQDLSDQKKAMQDQAVKVLINGGTKLPPKDENPDAVDYAIAALQRHVLIQKADAQAVGLGAAQLAIFRAQAIETAAVLKNGGEETAKQAADFKKLEAAAGAAAEALARAKIANAISFGRQTSFLSQEDVQIATQLKDIYPNVTQAINSSEAAQLRLNSAFREISTGIETNLTSGLTDIVTGTKSVSQGFSDMGIAIVKALDQAIIKMLIIQPLMASLQSGLSGLGIPGLGGPGVGETSAVAGASSGMYGGISFPKFASGTDSAPGGWAVVGENGPELMKVPTGSQILPNGQMPASNDNGRGNFTVNLIEDSSRSGQVTQSQNSSGGMDIYAFVDTINAKNLANPGSASRQVLATAGKVASR
jgi:hypothetical protein